MPAEFESQHALWLAWPHNAGDYTPKAACIPWVYAEICRVLQGRERVRCLVQSEQAAQKIRRLLRQVGVDDLAPLSEGERAGDAPWLEFYTVPTDRAWARDYLPTFVRRPTGGVAAIHFRFNGWALYENHTRDMQVPLALADELHWPLVSALHHDRHVVLEGGGIDTNGRGVLLTTEECYLDQATQTRNPGFTKQDYEDVFARYLGISQTIWLGNGIAGDDTHGHVDDLCRFVSPTAVVLSQEKNASDCNYKALAGNWERLQGVRLPGGEQLEVIALPMPDPIGYKGRRLPASYANAIIGNRTVLVPTFNAPQDVVALGIFKECFPERQVCGIYAGDLILGYGALHCLSHEEPAALE